MRDGALLIDLGGLRELTYDPATGSRRRARRCRAASSSTPFLAAHGRMFTGGHCESVGLGGFLLQGGQGWNSRRWGWGCENVVAVDVVTADGELVHADADENADLFWAARGAGPGFFGVVTRFHLRTHPARADVPRHAGVRAGRPRAAAALAARRAAGAGRRGRAGAGRDAARARRRRCCCCTRRSRRTPRTRAAAPLDGCPAAALEHERGPTTIAEENVAQTLQNPEGHRYAADSQWTDADAATLYPLLRDLYAELPTEHSFSIWYGWAPSRALPDMAFSLERNVYLATYAIWTDPADDERHRDWVHGHHARLAEVGEGVYLGDSDFSRRPDRFLADANARGSRRSAPRATPTACSASLLTWRRDDAAERSLA